MNLTKRYASAGSTVYAVRGVSFTVQTGEFYTLLGPSGCGKTTTLQCIAGLETPDGGEVRLGNLTAYSAAEAINVPAHRRGLGMVFQSYAIWPHMSVYDNVAFPLVYGSGRGKVRDVRGAVMRALAMVRLDALADRPAPLLSGGQQQRVALARALVHEPRVLLFDEPLSNLDAKLREDMRAEIRNITRSLGLTAIYVTHDQTEALAMSDRIAVMRDGAIVQEGTPRDVYLTPRDAFAADFIGSSNILDGRIASVGVDYVGVVDTDIGPLETLLPHGATAGLPAQVVVRPEVITLVDRARQTEALAPNLFEGEVEQAFFVGETVDAHIKVRNRRIRAKLDPYVRVGQGDRVTLGVPGNRCFVILPNRSPC
jgi:iron(III) transport system ATP-binding protein